MSRNADDTPKEGLTQQPIPIVEIRDHMTQENIIRLLSSEEAAEPCGGLEDGAFDDGAGVYEEIDDLFFEFGLEIFEARVV